jgi:anti-sigma factor (TIGR02949 family)
MFTWQEHSIFSATPPAPDMTRHAPEDDAESMPCAEALERIYEFLDGELTPDVEERIRQHLGHCRQCHPHFRHEEVFLRFLERRAQIVSAPPALRRRIVRMLVDEEAARHPE